ncbi:MAG TPA: hypothetical protein P5268_04420 [Candidatus Marinimicrobia bacterium]|nr:hypothetical protein [Candidatus Neomarinimicrobiota bacterium]HRS51364.1 hypothetical protein [Candidatus Neomarinimicrobiota bacterium]HRU92264.1 hypothetical protein [Candidatus Neomarinimicrobiota bacterium]
MALISSKSQNVVLIGAAFKAEITPLTEKLSQKLCRLTNIDFDYILTGSGLERARRCLAEKVASQDYRAIINVGTAGALSDTYPLKSLFYPDRFCALSNDHLISLTLPNDLLKFGHLLPSGWKSGTLFTSREPITSADKRRKILQNCQADAVDMEAFAYADFCQRHKIPFACLKVITDRADADVTENFNANLAESAQLLAENALILIDLLLHKFDIKAENG